MSVDNNAFPYINGFDKSGEVKYMVTIGKVPKKNPQNQKQNKTKNQTNQKKKQKKPPQKPYFSQVSIVSIVADLFNAFLPC